MSNIQSLHHKAHEKCDFLLRKNKSIWEVFNKQTKLKKSNYDIQWRATIRSCTFLLENTLPFPRHDKTKNSNNKIFLIEILYLIRDANEKILMLF